MLASLSSAIVKTRSCQATNQVQNMGCFDVFCTTCGGPFNSYTSWELPNMQGIDTEWLKDAFIEYYENDKCVKQVRVSYYDGYGRFEEPDGVEHDVIEAIYEGKVKMIHRLCKDRKDTPVKELRKYQQQFFDIDAIIEDNKQHLLQRPQ